MEITDVHTTNSVLGRTSAYVISTKIVTVLKDLELWNCSFNPYYPFFYRTVCLAYPCLEISVVRIPVTASNVKIKIIFISLSLLVLIPSFIFLLQNQVFRDPGLRECGDCGDLSLSVFLSVLFNNAVKIVSHR